MKRNCADKPLWTLHFHVGIYISLLKILEKEREREKTLEAELDPSLRTS